MRKVVAGISMLGVAFGYLEVQVDCLSHVPWAINTKMSLLCLLEQLTRLFCPRMTRQKTETNPHNDDKPDPNQTFLADPIKTET